MRGAVLVVLFLAAAALVSAENEKVDDKGKFFFGTFRTTTYTVVSASTSTVFATCLSGTDATVCGGRSARRARRKLDKAIEVSPETNDDLSSSLSNPESLSERDEDLVGSSKLAFTVWTTSRTTTSVTVFFTNTSSTVRVSFYCVAGGIALPNSCPGSG